MPGVESYVKDGELYFNRGVLLGYARYLVEIS